MHFKRQTRPCSLHIQFAVGIALVAVQFLTKSGQFIVCNIKPNAWAMLRAHPNGSRGERWLVRVFAFVSWLPFKMTMERARSAISGAMLAAKRRKNQSAASKSLLNTFRTYVFCTGYLFGLSSSEISSRRNDITIKAFGPSSKESDIEIFCSSESALWYSGLLIESNSKVSSMLVPWVYKCIWFKVRIFRVLSNSCLCDCQ